MIHYPTLSPIKQKQKAINAFKGYNHNLRIGDGEFYDDMNVVSDDYPVLSVRKKRDTTNFTKPGTLLGISYFNDWLIQICSVNVLDIKRLYVYATGENADFYVDMGIIDAADTAKRTVLRFGGYILIFPDRKWVDMAKGFLLYRPHGDIDQVTEIAVTEASPITYSVCDIEGNDYIDIETTLPVNPENGDLWIDTEAVPHVLKKYSVSLKTWEVLSTYIKIQYPGISSGFEKGDSVNIDGSTVIKKGDYPIWAIKKDTDDPSNDYIVITGITDEETTQTQGTVTVSRKMPQFDYMTVAGNRVWGCRYKYVLDSQSVVARVNEIWASKLGDFKNWYYYAGTSMDSYTVSLGQDEEFTGAITLNDKPVFFREHCIHTIYGDYPSNYTLETVTGTGVQAGCDKTLATHNGYAYYLSKDGIYAFNGSYPAKLYDAFGSDKFTDPACGVFSYNKYYLTCTKDGQPYMFVHDTDTGILHRENMPQVEQMVVVDDDIFYLTGNDVYSTRYRENSTEYVEWYAESGMIDLYMAEKKYVSQIHIRMALAPQSTCRIRVQYDSSREWERAAELIGTKLTSFTIPLRMKRADHVRIRLEGTGEAHIYSLTKTFSAGSDRA